MTYDYICRGVADDPDILALLAECPSGVGGRASSWRPSTSSS